MYPEHTVHFNHPLVLPSPTPRCSRTDTQLQPDSTKVLLLTSRQVDMNCTRNIGAYPLSTMFTPGFLWGIPNIVQELLYYHNA